MTTFPFVLTEQEERPSKHKPKIRLVMLTVLLSVLVLGGDVIVTSQHHVPESEYMEAFKTCLAALLVVYTFVAYRLMPYRAFMVILMLMLGSSGYGFYLLGSFS